MERFKAGGNSPFTARATKKELGSAQPLPKHLPWTKPVFSQNPLQIDNPAGDWIEYICSFMNNYK